MNARRTAARIFARLTAACALSSFGGSCGDAGREGARDSAFVPPRLCISSEGRGLLALDARGTVSIGAACERSLTPHPVARVKFLFASTSDPMVTIDGFGLSPTEASQGYRWLPTPALPKTLVTPPDYRSPTLGSCDVEPELSALSRLLGVLPGISAEAPEAAFDPASSRGDACLTRDLLRCYLRASSAKPAQGAGGADGRVLGEDDAFAIAQAAQRAAECASDNAGRESSALSFAVTPSSLLFTPSPLFSISIYEGKPASYDAALVDAVPTAFVAVPETCADPRKTCVASPWPISKCSKCTDLKAGKTYTAYLLEGAGQLRRDVKSVTFTR